MATPHRTNARAVSPVALICTLGGKPQVVTFALDELLAQQVGVSRVHVLHLSIADDRVRRSVEVLHNEVRSHSAYVSREIRFESVTVKPVLGTTQDGRHPVRGEPIESADDPIAADAIWMTVHQLLARLKGEGYGVHVCVAGGPRLLALQTLSVGSLMLGGDDRCWHVYSPKNVIDEAGEGSLLHARGRGVRLVSVPWLPLGNLAPILRHIAFARPEDVLAAGQQRMNAERLQVCKQVATRLTKMQRRVLREYATRANSQAEAAMALGIKASTVKTHTSVILAECREAWGDAPDAKLNHHVVRERFGGLPDSFWEGL